MKTLTLIRHAKSSWEFNVTDHERPLKDRGINDANLVAKALVLNEIEVDKVIVSDAQRTKQTADIILSKLKVQSNKISFNHKVYDFSGKDLTEVIMACENSVNHLMVFGHNHAITAFVNTYGNRFIDNVPTCGVVTIAFHTDHWAKLSDGKTMSTIFPRELR